MIKEQEKAEEKIKTGFEFEKRDAQSTMVKPISVDAFDFEKYRAYELSLEKRQQEFCQGNGGILVYRRVRADGVFYDKCKDKKESLALQLGALEKSLSYQGDIANFLEPWYGIGYIAGCYGGTYEFMPEQSPSVKPLFSSVQALLEADKKPLDQTPMGQHILEMTEYFMDQTKGKLPVSLTDVQAPINMLSYLVPITELFMELLDEPQKVEKAAIEVASLLGDFLKKQQNLIGDCLVLPGHGFGSCRTFQGIGLSDDNSIMIDGQDYQDVFSPADEILGHIFGGLAFHSCGNWERKIPMVKEMKGLIMADGAFTYQTDPAPNEPKPFGEAFAGSNIILNARAVGNHAFEIFQKLYKPNMKLIAVTYCEGVKEQETLYKALHQMAKDQRL